MIRIFTLIHVLGLHSDHEVGQGERASRRQDPDAGPSGEDARLSGLESHAAPSNASCDGVSGGVVSRRGLVNVSEGSGAENVVGVDDVSAREGDVERLRDSDTAVLADAGKGGEAASADSSAVRTASHPRVIGGVPRLRGLNDSDTDESDDGVKHSGPEAPKTASRVVRLRGLNDSDSSGSGEKCG